MKNRSSCFLIFAAVAALSLPVHAQFLVNNGNAADANTRAGSYGSNGYDNGRPINSATVNGNQIVTGNVTGGRALQTNPGYFAPGQLETYTGTEEFQDFIRDSTGVPQPYQQSQPGYLAAQPFYSGPTTAAPPAGFVRNTNTGAYIPSTPAGPQLSYDTRVGVLNPTGITPADAGLTPSQSIVPQTSIVSGAELYGPTVTSGAEQQEQSSPFNNAYRQWNPQDQQQLSQSNLAQMRSELDQSQPANSNGSNPNAPTGANPTSLNPQSLTPAALNAQANTTSLAQNTPGQPGGAASPQPNVALLAPAQQSAQYAQLQQRFKQFESGVPAPSVTAPGENTNEANPSIPSQLNTPEQNAHLRADLYPPSVASSPLLIHSLAVGIHAKGLRQVMADAEEHMRQGRYAEAMLRYAAAQQVAPNNTLIPLGRSFAELGAGYYVRAEHDLRGALQADPVLLMGRYDLKNLLGESRLEFIVRDLKQITVADKQNTPAPFLLAYIAYNTGSTTAAAQYLDLTEQRSNGNVPIIGVMRQYWGLSTAKK